MQYMHSHTEALRSSLDAVAARADEAEAHSRWLDVQLQAALAAVSKLEFKNVDLMKQNLKLEQKAQELQARIESMQADAAVNLAVRQEAEATINELRRMQNQCDKETQVCQGMLRSAWDSQGKLPLGGQDQTTPTVSASSVHRRPHGSSCPPAVQVDPSVLEVHCAEARQMRRKTRPLARGPSSKRETGGKRVSLVSRGSVTSQGSHASGDDK